MKCIITLLFLLLFTGLSAISQNSSLEYVQKGRNLELNKIVFSRDGKQIIGCLQYYDNNKWNNEIEIWDVESGNLIKSFTSNTNAELASMSPDGKKIIVSTRQSNQLLKVYEYEVETGNLLQSTQLTPIDEYSLISGICYLPGGKRFATYIHTSSKIQVFKSGTGELDYEIGIGNKKVNRSCFSLDGKLAAVSFADSSIVVWSLETAKQIASFKTNKINYFIGISGNGLFIGAGASNKEQAKPLTIYEISTGKIIGEWQSDFEYSFPNISYDGSLIANSTSKYSPVIVYKSDSPDFKRTISQSIFGSKLAFSPTGNILGAIGNDARIWLWDASTGDLLKKLSRHANDAHPNITGMEFSLDGSMLATTGSDGNLKIWDGSDYSLKKDIQVSYNWSMCLDFSSNGSWLAVGSADNLIYKYNLKDWKITGINNGLGSIVTCLDWANSKQFPYIVYAGYDNGVLVGGGNLDNTGYLIDSSWKKVNCLAFSSDDSKIIGGSKDKYVKVWRKGGLMEKPWVLDKTWKADSSSNPLTSGVMYARFIDKDSKIITISAEDPYMRIWDSQTYNLIGQYLTTDENDNYGTIQAAMMDSSGKYIFTVLAFNRIRIYDATTGKVICKIDTLHVDGKPEFQIQAMVASNDNRRLIVGCNDGSFYVFDISFLKVGVNVNQTELRDIITISPNPASEFIEISIGGQMLMPSAEVYNSLGECVMNLGIQNSGPMRIDISSLPPGLYFVKAGERVNKFVKI